MKKKKRGQTADGRKMHEGQRSVTGRRLARYDRMIEIVTRREHRLQRKVHELDERYQIQMRALTQQLKEAARRRHELESQQREAEHTYDRETAGVGL